VEAPLLCGHGGSHQDLLASTWQDWLAGVQETLDQLLAECDDVYVGGLSMGAVLALTLAAHNPQVKGLMMLSPHMGILQDNLQFNQFLLPLGFALKPTHNVFYWTEKPPYGLKDERLQKSIKRAIKASESGETTNYGLFRTYVGSLYQLDGLIRHAHANTHKVQCPVLCVQSLEDTVTKVENATNLYAALGSRQKQLHLLTGCNHVMTVDLRKKDVACLMETFMQNSLVDDTDFAAIAPVLTTETEGKKAKENNLHIQLHPRLNALSEAEWTALCTQIPFVQQFEPEHIQCHSMAMHDSRQALFQLWLYELPVSARKLEIEAFSPVWLKPTLRVLGHWIPGWGNTDALVVCFAETEGSHQALLLGDMELPQDLPQPAWNIASEILGKLKIAFQASRTELSSTQDEMAYPNPVYTVETV
jgi:carboxylesterase